MKIEIVIDENRLEEDITSQCVRYIKEKQMPQMIGIISKEIAQEVKGEVVDSGMLEKRVDEVVKRVENTLMIRANKHFSETLDKANEMSSVAIERSATLQGDGKAVRDHMIATLIGFQNEIGCDENSEEYKAYQKMLEWVERNYGPMMS